MSPKRRYSKHFTLEEAVSHLPFAKQTLEKAHAVLNPLREELVLYKRLFETHQDEKDELFDVSDHNPYETVLNDKVCCYEDEFREWVTEFTDKGIHVNNFEQGKLHFPYIAKDGTELLLSWHMDDDGLFYFMEPKEAPDERLPISFLPESA